MPPPRAQGFIRAALAATEQVQDFFKGDESAQAVAALKKEVHVDIDNAVAKFAKIDFLLIQSVNVKNIATAVIRHQYEHLKATIERGLISIKDGHDYAAVIARDMKMLDRSQDDEVAELVQRKLGASDSLTLIGYREPFCFLGWKGAQKGKGVYALDAKKQSKQLLRLDAVVTYDKGELAMTWKSSQVKLLEQLPPAKKRRTEE